MKRFFASRWGPIVSGAIIGVLAALLVYWGNPKNMGVCVACFERDIAGALGLHRNAATQYLRPEIIGFVLGSTIAALLFREFRPRAGSAPIARFLLGMFAMIGALVFLGCPWRALLRLAGGDLNALLALAGLATGVGIGVLLMRGGYSLGRAWPQPAVIGWLMPALMVGLLLLAIFRPVFGEGLPIFASTKGPGAAHAALAVSLVVGLVVGFLGQRSRFCTMGALRDLFLMGETHLLGGVVALLVAAFATNLILTWTTGTPYVRFSFYDQPVAHSNHFWNFAGMVLAGLAFALAGGCPGRQLFLSGEGDGDAAIFVLGMIVGAGFAHNFALAGVPDQRLETGLLKVGGPSIYGQVAVAIGLAFCLILGLTARLRSSEVQR